MKKFFFSLSIFSGMIGTNVLFAAEEPKILTTTIETVIESDAFSTGSGNQSTIATQDWYWNITLPDGYDIEINTGGKKQIEGAGYDGSWNDSYLQFQKNLYKSDFLTFNLSARYIIPLSESSREFKHMRWGMQIRPTFVFTLYSGSGMKLTFRTRPTYNEFYYSQDYNNNGLYNMQRSFVLANRLKLDIDPFYFYVLADYTTYWNTNGDHVDDKWFTLLSLGWNVNANYYLEFYRGSGNRVFDANTGGTNNIDVFDDSIATYGFLVGVTF